MVVVLIPAYQPDEALVKLVKQLKSDNFSCLVVDDGSGESYADIFEQIKDIASVVHAPKNGGKRRIFETAPCLALRARTGAPLFPRQKNNTIGHKFYRNRAKKMLYCK